MKSAGKTSITEALFIDWLQTQFISRKNQLHIRTHSDEPIVPLANGHTSYITLQVAAYAGSQRKIPISFTAHSFRISPRLDLSVISLFKILYKREKCINPEERC
jgi:hypothetical protein